MNRESRILSLLKTWDPTHLEIQNESDAHAGPPGRETHFKVLIVSEKFKNTSRVDRQRSIYELLRDELQSGLHALSLKALTPEEWAQTTTTFQSPECHKK